MSALLLHVYIIGRCVYDASRRRLGCAFANARPPPHYAGDYVGGSVVSIGNITNAVFTLLAYNIDGHSHATCNVIGVCSAFANHVRDDRSWTHSTSMRCGVIKIRRTSGTCRNVLRAVSVLFASFEYYPSVNQLKCERVINHQWHQSSLSDNIRLYTET